MLAYGYNALKYNGNLNLAADIRDAGNILCFLNTDGIVSILPGWDNCVKIKIIFGRCGLLWGHRLVGPGVYCLDDFGMDGVGRVCSFSMLCVIFVGTVTDADDSVMADVMTKEQRSRCMSRIKGKDTKPEMIVRRWLWSRGYRYRKHVKRLPGTPDIVLRKYGIVIFIHGCFWHGHEEHMHLPKSNADFWTAKIRRNKERDEAQKDRLRAMGWNVLTVWECQLKPAVRARTLASIEYFINHSYLMKQQAAAYTDTAPTSEPLPMAAESAAPYGE